MFQSMKVDRVTISLPREVREAAQAVAKANGVPLSSVFNDAIESWLRGRLVDPWLREFEASHGSFDEDELKALAIEAGVPYSVRMPSAKPSAA